MLSRRHLRIKVLQALYAFFQSENDRIDVGEKELLKSLNKIYEIYIYQLSLLVEIVEFAQKRAEENKKKFFPTPDDLNPNTRFTKNRIILQIESNKDFRRYFDVYKINWADQEDMIRKIFNKLKLSEDYKTYMDNKISTYNHEKDILVRIIKKYFSGSDTLQSYYEEKNIHWTDDFHTANLLAIKTVKGLTDKFDENSKLPTLLKNSTIDDPDEDIQFVKILFRKTIIRSEEYIKLIDEKVKNWEMDRIAVMDIIILKMAITELLEFPSIPIKVTMNEYIELAKMYSTPKSKIFVNGILDKLIVDLKTDNLIKKTGRGLLEN
ncbi:MAG: transcription antitermination factor NusB [Bacteroidales bacterium]|nr:transcription antitermination factor NusB [Bacteroidales bacterium]MCF8403871.1 transcription antitermination factor NusB [Bacteroidales bacterium]